MSVDVAPRAVKQAQGPAQLRSPAAREHEGYVRRYMVIVSLWKTDSKGVDGG